MTFYPVAQAVSFKLHRGASWLLEVGAMTKQREHGWRIFF